MTNARELVELASSIGHREHALYGRQSQISLAIESGDTAQADALIRAFTQEAHELRQPFYIWLAAVFHAMRALLDGRFDEAERLAQEARVLGEEAQSGTNLAFQFFAIQLFAMRWEQGRLSELTDVVRGFVEQYPALSWRVGLAFLHSELGDDESARSELEKVFPGEALEIPNNANLVISLVFLAEVCSRLHDVSRAPVVHDALKPFDGRCGIIGAPAACVGAVARPLALLESTLGRWGEAERHFEAALAMNTRLGALPLVARTKVGFARMLLERATAGDAERASAMLAEAAAVASELGMRRLSEEIKEVRRTHLHT
jgi:hypothetical protein